MKGSPSSVDSPATASRAPDPEVKEKATRRKFNAEYKRRILQEADACAQSGQIGALLRREGLYASHLRQWRSLRASAIEHGLEPRKRGRPVSRNPLADENLRLERVNRRLCGQVEQMKLIIDIQKKASQILGIQLADVSGIETEMNLKESDS